MSYSSFQQEAWCGGVAVFDFAEGIGVEGGQQVECVVWKPDVAEDLEEKIL